MKLLVLGHSDSEGTRLPNRYDAWPYLVAERYREATNQPMDVVHKLLFAGPTAAAYVRKQLDAEQPNAVVVATSTYGVVIQLVSNRVNERFGPRAARLAARAERFAQQATYRLGPVASRPLVGARRLTRRIIGTSAALSFDGMIQSYEDCFAVLARAEDVETVILGGAGYTLQHARMNPRLNELQDRSTEEFRRMAGHHHFGFLSHEALLGGRQHKEPYYHPDGVHTGEESNRIVADALAPLLLQRLA
jgi:hypothetical protein